MHSLKHEIASSSTFRCWCLRVKNAGAKRQYPYTWHGLFRHWPRAGTLERHRCSNGMGWAVGQPEGRRGVAPINTQRLQICGLRACSWFSGWRQALRRWRAKACPESADAQRALGRGRCVRQSVSHQGHCARAQPPDWLANAPVALSMSRCAAWTVAFREAAVSSALRRSFCSFASSASMVRAAWRSRSTSASRRRSLAKWRFSASSAAFVLRS